METCKVSLLLLYYPDNMEVKLPEVFYIFPTKFSIFFQIPVLILCTAALVLYIEKSYNL
jgi:hypothetical protein